MTRIRSVCDAITKAARPGEKVEAVGSDRKLETTLSASITVIRNQITQMKRLANGEVIEKPYGFMLK